MPPYNTPPNEQGPNNSRRNTMFGVIALVVIGLLLFVFMSQGRTSDADMMQQGNGMQDQDQQAPAGTDDGAINDSATPDADATTPPPTTQP